VCPTECIVFDQEPEQVETRVGAVIIATGLDITPMALKPEYGGGRFLNVMNPLAMERVQSSNGPYGRVLRPSDGKIPGKIAYVQCAGSRDRSIGIPYCSRVCCMYSLKQALLLRHYIHDVDVTLYHMDIRAFGKGYEQFYRRTMNEGVRVIGGRPRPSRGREQRPGAVELLDEGGRVDEHRYDLACRAGVDSAWHARAAWWRDEASDGFLTTPEAINLSFTTSRVSTCRSGRALRTFRTRSSRPARRPWRRPAACSASAGTTRRPWRPRCTEPLGGEYGREEDRQSRTTPAADRDPARPGRRRQQGAPGLRQGAGEDPQAAARRARGRAAHSARAGGPV
jgi:hypothetical protein